MSELLQFSKRCRSVWVIAAKRVTLLGLIVAGWPVDAKTANASARCIDRRFFSPVSQTYLQEFRLSYAAAGCKLISVYKKRRTSNRFLEALFS